MIIRSHIPSFVKLVALFILLVTSGNTFANNRTDSTYKAVAEGEILQLNITAPSGLNYKLSSNKAYIKVSVGDIYELGTTFQFEARIKFSIGEPVINPAEYEVVLTHEQPEQVLLYDVLSKLSDLSLIQVQVNQITVPSFTNESVREYVMGNLQVNIAHRPEIKTDVRLEESGKPLAPYISRLKGGVEITNRVQTFNWDNPETKDFPNYQFQLLRLYNVDGATSSDPKVITAEINWEKALDIVTETSDKKLTIAVVEGSGYYVWRVRPLGNYYNGGITDPRNYGEWSDAPEDGQRMNVNKSNALLYKCIFYLEDPEDDQNWIYSRVFTENNRVSESMTYAGYLNQVRQSQSYLPSKDTTIITQSILDYSGRPSLQTIPVPVEGGIKSYRKDFVTSGNNLYTAQQFDDELTVSSPSQVDSSGFFVYYSDANTDKFIPTSEGYPFSRTIFENSPLGRQIEQSGIGKAHAIGEQVDGMGRTTRIYYCKPSDEELIRVFGDEALPAKAVLKTVTIDPNNTSSVTYTSTSGKVIATCLIRDGEDKGHLDDIDGYNGVGEDLIREVIRENHKTADGFISEREIIVSFPSELKVRYFIPRPSETFGCTEISADCEYVVSFTIEKENTDSVWKSGEYYLKGVQDRTITWMPEEGKKFSKGIYTIKKSIRSEASRNNPHVYARIDESLDPVKNISNVIYSWLDKIDAEKEMYLFYRDLTDFSRMLKKERYDSIRMKNFNLGKVFLHDTAFQLKTKTGYNPLKVMVLPEYDSVNSEYPDMIVITGGCCGDVTIPATLKPETVCYNADEIRETPSLSPDFWGYLKKVLVEPYGDSLDISMTNVPGKTNIMYGYDSISLNKMIFYMLTDKYYTGATIELDGKIVKPDSTPIIEADKEVQYTCDELWNCWKGTINAYIDIISNNYANGLTTVDQGMEDDAENRGDEEGSPKDGFFDSESNNLGGFFFRTFLKRKLSRRMKDFENIGEDDSGGDPIQFEFRLMEQFLNCAGFRFAGIVEKTGTDTYTGILEDDLFPNKEYGYKHSGYFYDNAGYKFPKDSLFQPYLKNPMYAFKYFQYDNDLTISKTPTTKWLNVEVDFHYDSYEDKSLCEPDLRIRTHENWNAYERYLFYGMVKERKPYEFSDEGTEPIGFETKLDSAMRATFEEMAASCSEICNERRERLENAVRQTFEDNCYVLNGCPSDSNVVLDKDITAIVDGLIGECESGCNAIFKTAGDGGYPKIETPTCERVNNTGTAWETVSGESKPIILPADLEHQYNILKDWNFVFALDDSYSRCKYLDQFSGQSIASDWTVFDNDRWGGSQVYTDSNLVLVTKGENRSTGVFVMRDDLVDNFSLTIKVDSLNTLNNAANAGIIVFNEEKNLINGFAKFGIIGNELFYASDTINVIESGITITYPFWIKLERNGNSFTAYYKTSLENAWNSFGNVTAEVPYKPTIGLYVNSPGNTGPAVVAFDNFNGGKKFPNRLNSNNTWIGNTESPYPPYDKKGFPKKYSETLHKDVTVEP